MLHKRLSSKTFRVHRNITPDGVVCSLPVDQFPCKDFNKNPCGFHKSDVSILAELSGQQQLDMDLYKQFAARINNIAAKQGVNIMSGDKIDREKATQLIHQWKPAWIQTQAEERAYINWFVTTSQDTHLDKDEIDEQIEQSEVETTE